MNSDFQSQVKHESCPANLVFCPLHHAFQFHCLREGPVWGGLGKIQETIPSFLTSHIQSPNYYQPEYDSFVKRAWNSGFTGGMGKRAWNSGFTGMPSLKERYGYEKYAFLIKKWMRLRMITLHKIEIIFWRLLELEEFDIWIDFLQVV